MKNLSKNTWNAIQTNLGDLNIRTQAVVKYMDRFYMRIAYSTHAQCWKILLVLNNHLHAILVSLVSCEKKWVIFSNISSRVWKSMKIRFHGHNYELNTVVNFRSSHPEVFRKKGVHINFTKFTGKHLCLSLFFNKVF